MLSARLLALSVLAFQSLAQPELQPEPRPPAPEAPAAEPAGAAAATDRPVLDTRFTAGHAITIRATVNGREPGWFILDTGAALTHLDRTIAGKLELKTHPSPPGYADALADGVSFELSPGVAFTANNVGIRDLSSYSDLYGLHVDGLLGLDLISKVVMKIDHDAQSIELIPRAEVSAEPGDWVTMSTFGRERGALLTTAVLGAPGNDNAGPAVLAIDMAIPTIVQVFDDTPQAKALLAARDPEFHGSMPGWTGQGWCSVNVQLADSGFARMACVEVTERHPLAYDTMQGFVGAAFFASQSPIILDAGAGVVKFTRDQHPGDFYLGGRARGMGLMTSAQSPGQVFVMGVAPGSAAAGAGVALYDRIITIDDMPADADVMRWLPGYFDIMRERAVELVLLRGYQSVELRVGAARNCAE